MSHQERAIFNWNSEIRDAFMRNEDSKAQSQRDEMSLYSDIAVAYILVTLFRPCPRLKYPSSSNRLKAFSVAAGVAEGSWRQADLEFGNSKHVFHWCRHSSSAVITCIEALQRVRAAPCGRTEKPR
jgi:hypothetical protein